MGDYYRGQFTGCRDEVFKEQLRQEAMVFYQDALKNNMNRAHPLITALHLNYSVFLHDNLVNREQEGIDFARKSLREAEEARSSLSSDE